MADDIRPAESAVPGLPRYLRRLAFSAAFRPDAALESSVVRDIVDAALDGIAEHWAARGAALARAAAEVERGERLRHAHWLAAQRLRGELEVALQQLAVALQQRDAVRVEIDEWATELHDALGIVGAEEDIDPFEAVRDLHREIDRLRELLGGSATRCSAYPGCGCVSAADMPDGTCSLDPGGAS